LDIPLLLFAKAPIAGKVKTRLQSHCSAEQAAEIAKVLLEESIVKAKKFWPGTVYLSVALDMEHDFLQAMLKKYSIELVCCDAPHILADDLKRAYTLLSEKKPVLGPSDDGGYYFIGLDKPQATLFSNIEWGTSSVLMATLKAAQQQMLDFTLLEPLNDVDEWQDLVAASGQIPSLTVFTGS